MLYCVLVVVVSSCMLLLFIAFCVIVVVVAFVLFAFYFYESINLLVCLFRNCWVARCRRAAIIQQSVYPNRQKSIWDLIHSQTQYIRSIQLRWLFSQSRSHFISGLTFPNLYRNSRRAAIVYYY